MKETGPYRIKKFACSVALTLAVLTLMNCGKARVDVHHDTGKNWDYPETVAVLPFFYDSSLDQNKDTSSIFREAFFNYFSYLGYNDLALDIVDLKLKPIIKTGVSVNDISNGQLMKTLGVDAVIRGSILNATNFTAGIYAETSIEANLEMIDIRTNKVLWNTKHIESDTSGILTPSLVDFFDDQVNNSKVNEAYNRVAESFVLKILAKIPDPASLRHNEVRLPRIEYIEANIKGNNKLQPNDLIYVSMQGESNLVGHFDIGSFKTGIPMKEVSPGLYTGSYRIKKGDRIDSALIIASLSTKNGLTAKKFYKKALATKETQTKALPEKK